MTNVPLKGSRTELRKHRASYVVGHPHNRLHALETLGIFWVTEPERFVYIKVTVSIKIVGFFPLTDQEHMDITKMAAMWWDYYYKIAAVLNLNQRLQSWYQETFSLIWLISAVIKKHSVFIQYIQLRTFLWESVSASCSRFIFNLWKAAQTAASLTSDALKGLTVLLHQDAVICVHLSLKFARLFGLELGDTEAELTDDTTGWNKDLCTITKNTLTVRCTSLLCEDFVTCYLAGQYLLVVIFLPLTVLVEVDTDRKLPMLPPPPPPKEVDEKEVKPPPPILPIVVMWPMWPIWPTALMEPKEPKAKSKKLICLIHLSKRSTLPTVLEPLCSSGSFTLANSLPGSKGEKPAPKAGKPKPPKKGPPVRLRLARLWCRRPLPKNESSLNGSAPERRKSQSARITENHSRRPKVFKHAAQSWTQSQTQWCSFVQLNGGLTKKVCKRVSGTKEFPENIFWVTERERFMEMLSIVEVRPWNIKSVKSDVKSVHPAGAGK